MILLATTVWSYNNKNHFFFYISRMIRIVIFVLFFHFSLIIKKYCCYYMIIIKTVRSDATDAIFSFSAIFLSFVLWKCVKRSQTPFRVLRKKTKPEWPCRFRKSLTRSAKSVKTINKTMFDEMNFTDSSEFKWIVF